MLENEVISENLNGYDNVRKFTKGRRNHRDFTAVCSRKCPEVLAYHLQMLAMSCRHSSRTLSCKEIIMRKNLG